MKFSTKTIILNPIFFFFIMINYMRPACIMDIAPTSIVHFLSVWDKFFGIPVIAICLLAIVKDSKCFLWDIVTLYFYKIICTVIVTLIAVGTITGAGSFRHIWTLSAIMFVSLALKYDFNRTVSRLTYLFAILVFINFATILAFPKGMYFKVNYENYFLGYDNGHIVVYMPALFFSYEHALRKHRCFLTISIWISIFFSVLICRSGTTLLGMFTLVFLMIVIHFRLVRKYLFNWKTVSLVIILLFVLIVILRKQMDFRDLIMSLFGKDVTLTGRTVLWDRAFRFFMANPFFGTGDNIDINKSMFQLNSQIIAYSHNEFLDILVRSGIVGFVLYVNCIIKSFKIIKKYDMELLSWLAILAAYLVSMMFESYSNYSFYYFYFVILLIPRYLIEQNISTNDVNNLKEKKLD